MAASGSRFRCAASSRTGGSPTRRAARTAGTLPAAMEISPLICQIFDDGIARYEERELSPNIIRRLEDATGLDIRAPGFPAEMTDDEPEEPGYEVVPTGLHSEA